jgi:hypothetical protein
MTIWLTQNAINVMLTSNALQAINLIDKIVYTFNKGDLRMMIDSGHPLRTYAHILRIHMCNIICCRDIIIDQITVIEFEGYASSAVMRIIDYSILTECVAIR